MASITLTRPVEPIFLQYASASSENVFPPLYSMADTCNENFHSLSKEDLLVIRDAVSSRSGSLETASEMTSEAEECSPTLRVEHVVRLSSIEHCMPRAYIRVCLAYSVSDDSVLYDAIDRLRVFIRKIVDAKPYLSGYVMSAQDPSSPSGKVEIRFTCEDFLNFPAIKIRHFDSMEMPYKYQELNDKGLPPSAIRPDLVSALPEAADDPRAPVFRVQANVITGGLVVSFYLHHCISDGTGLGFLISGSILHDDFTFERHLTSSEYVVPDLNQRLSAFAHQASAVRSGLSWSSPNQITTRHIAHKYFTVANCISPLKKVPGRGCVFAFPYAKIELLKARTQGHNPGKFVSINDIFQALLWHHMTKARIPSLEEIYGIMTSKLLIPVNIRAKVVPNLAPSYFGAAVDFAAACLNVNYLCNTTDYALARTAVHIRAAIKQVDEPYIRASIALANSPDASIDVRDLQASNMNRTTGADMYITSWEKLPLYKSELDMGLGRPDWVRKPWSKDPGSCIILPRDERKDFIEVVIQMTEPDMARLLEDKEFMSYVSRVVE